MAVDTLGIALAAKAGRGFELEPRPLRFIQALSSVSIAKCFRSIARAIRLKCMLQAIEKIWRGFGGGLTNRD